jgi:hypothetical protein
MGHKVKQLAHQKQRQISSLFNHLSSLPLKMSLMIWRGL